MLTEDSVISVQDVLQVVQRSLVLMGNANVLLTEAKRNRILHSVDKSLQGLRGLHWWLPVWKGFHDLSEMRSWEWKLAVASGVIGQAPPPVWQAVPVHPGTNKQLVFFPKGPTGKLGPQQGHQSTPRKFVPNKQSYNSRPFRLPLGKSGRF